MIPDKLVSGDQIRVISPARSLSMIAYRDRNIAIRILSDLGFKVTFSKHAEEEDEFLSSSIESRVEDLHEAFSDSNVKGILTTIGGYNSNQLLSHIDYSLIKNNPKVFCGYSDITALSNAMYAKTGLVTYSGPHFSSFGMLKGIDYTKEYFSKCLLRSEAFVIRPSATWSDDEWYRDQENRSFIPNDGFFVIQPGKASGKILGGNLCTFNLLHGTEFMPALNNSILLIEDDYGTSPETFDRDLQSLIHQHGFKEVKGILIGRFQKASGVTEEKLIKIIKTKRELENIPVAAGLDFGHTTPQITFPIGGYAKLNCNDHHVELEIVEH